VANPLRELRLTKGWERKRLARQLRLSYYNVACAELGYPRDLPRTIVEALDRAGFDGERLRQSYQSWREEVLARECNNKWPPGRQPGGRRRDYGGG
jgi:hypothetical protein